MRWLVCWLTVFLWSVPINAQRITSDQITNLSYELIPTYELPKQYIIDGRTKLYPKENTFRRADIVFFLAIPVSFYLMQNILNFINILNVTAGNYNTDLGRDNFGFTSGEWNFLLAATFLIPMGVSIYDYVYVRQYPLIPPFERNEIKEIRMNFSIYRVSF